MQAPLHNDYKLTIDAVTAIRDAVAGSVVVKSKDETYLPNPSDFGKDEKRYAQYLFGAEFDGYPEQTLRSMIGKLKFDGTKIELPDSVGYLVEDTDGDGMSLRAMLRQTASEIIQVKWQLLVADFQGLTDVAIDDISIAEAGELNARAVIKSYTRENLIYWHFGRVNGKQQLDFIMLREFGVIFDQKDMTEKQVTSYLVLALDEDGNYYQQKYAQTKDNSLVEGERKSVMVGGAPLKWLPVQIACDEMSVTGQLPIELGFIGPICDLTFARYRVSAEYKETMRNMPPTTYISGLSSNSMNLFKEANGRESIATGSNAVNFLAEGMTVESVSANADLELYERYFKDNEAKIRSVGGVIISDSMTDKTATEISTNAAEQNARLADIADGIESAYKRIISYCMMFEGAIGQDNIEQSMGSITLEINRDFAASKMTVDEVRAVQELVMNGLISRKSAIDKLIAGGWLEGDAEAILAEIETTV